MIAQGDKKFKHENPDSTGTASSSTPAGSDDRPICYWDPIVKKFIYRASALFGACPRALYLARSGELAHRPPPALQKAFDRGNEFEPIIIRELEEMGFNVRATHGSGGQNEMEVPVGSNAIIRSHADGEIEFEVAVDLNDRFEIRGDAFHGTTSTLECKTMNLANWKKFHKSGFAGIELGQKYLGQIAIYLKAAPDRGVLFVSRVVDPAHPGDKRKVFYYFEAGKSPVPFGLIAKKVLDVERVAAVGKLPQCDPKALKSWCGYQHLHEPEPESEVVEDPGAGVQLAEYWKMSRLKSEFEKQAEEIKKKLKPIGEELMARLEDHEAQAGRLIKKLKAGVYTFERGCTVSFDASGFFAKHVEISTEERGMFIRSTFWPKVTGPKNMPDATPVNNEWKKESDPTRITDPLEVGDLVDRAREVFPDSDFVDSVEEQYEKKGWISDKQAAGLENMIAKGKD